MLRPTMIATTVLLAAFASATSPVGTWTGKLQMKMPPLPANAPPAQKQMMTKMLAGFQTARFMLTLKADKSYTGKTVGLPGAQPPAETGTWSQAGNVLTLIPKTGGKGAQKLTMSSNGKTMAMPLPGGRGQAVFSR